MISDDWRLAQRKELRNMKKMFKISRSVLLSALAALAFGGERSWKSELF